ncbi:diacylglycerol kinase family protein [Novosphingobium album (ex Hu et al. 2023)]|uniref:Diacylglycerol kinase family protein n=1 Tax=Novosphingobium album (ex Hu et al. 2023) TaxID=2930093 RepID=A0ABT0B250_9SPHN|nr:diacylglycerol kinase family protein [Novosphingobium album (ex Hu et al. 2023)]MCJ2178996.1 diacylglycerol kinase family protein [Novosphingobium album (ex Hu et al. 2023)]
MLTPPEEPAPHHRFSIFARLKSFTYAGRGLRALVQDEHNAWLHLAASLMALAAGFLLQISIAGWRWLVLAIAIVWLAEAFNTAIEEACDYINPEFDRAIGRIKDLAAGGVLIASIAAALIGLLTLAPPLLARIL